LPPVGVGTRGPGEQQIEIDRRLVQRRLLQLQRELADVQARKTREVLARRAEHFTVGLVGYTNAGKSSIFNALTAGGAYAADKPFATLATRVERWNVGAGEEVMLSDTVGFIRDLRTTSWRASARPSRTRSTPTRSSSCSTWPTRTRSGSGRP